ncbi:HPF/RaiA family ribosome-associated protein [Ferrovibrio xuzhouensis]|uniref:HPF/RaiA family ribosome-associated protein n=1 Tax=Ferrovibrio xuzhouensis TaxID=1576914 RepID=A0ABV7VAI4_9PROT
MELPLQISFRNMDPSDAVVTRIHEKARLLDRFYGRVSACRVTVEAPHRHHHKGNLYRIRIDLTVPGGELVVDRSPDEHHAHADVYVAIRDAFDAAIRRLEDFSRHQRGDVKAHIEPLQGRVAGLIAGQDYGFIELADGEEVYFHRNSVVDGHFEDLVVGTRVTLTTAMGEKGLQASTVHPVGLGHRQAG